MYKSFSRKRGDFSGAIQNRETAPPLWHGPELVALIPHGAPQTFYTA
jgi:hypothetical protein